jgi:hypothetical protein
MTTETKLRGLWVLTILALLWMTVMWCNDIATVKSQQTEIYNLNHVNDSLSIECDSLREENFNTSIDNGRYELSLENLKEINPKAAKQFEKYFEHKTE